MRQLDWFNRNPNAPQAWLSKLNLKIGEIVMVGGHMYRYSVERDRDHVLTPVEPNRMGREETK